MKPLAIPIVESHVSLPLEPQAGLVTFSLFSNESGLMDEAALELSRGYGPILEPVCRYPFVHSDYYQGEMGGQLEKRILAFRTLRPREALAELKHTGFELEKRWSRDGSGETRRINLDPGFLALEHFLLFTYKPRAHKIHIGQGVYADLQLLYRRERQAYEGLPWTFPDYLEAPVLVCLNAWRRFLKQALKVPDPLP